MFATTHPTDTLQIAKSYRADQFATTDDRCPVVVRGSRRWTRTRTAHAARR